MWKHRKLLKLEGRPILNASLVSDLPEAILLPDKIAIFKCAAHTNDKSFTSTGNARADMAEDQNEDNSKRATCAQVDINLYISPCLQSMQSFSTGAEKKQLEGIRLFIACGDPLLERPVFPNISFLNIMLS